MTEPVSTTLFQRFQQGDQQALGALFDHLRPYVRVIVSGMRKDRPSANDSDLIQDALMQAANSIDDFQGGSAGELVRWLRTIVVRTTYRTLQSADNNGWTDPDEAHLATLIVDPGSAPGDEAIRHEQSASMAVALSRLSDDMQQVLRCRLVDDLDYARIAEHLGRSPGAVRVLYVRALQRLRDVWSEEFESHD